MSGFTHDHEARLGKLRELMSKADLPAILISDPLNRAYLSGFEGSSGYLVITGDRAVLLTDFRYTEQAAAQAPEFEVLKHEPRVGQTINEVLDRYGIERLGFEDANLTVKQYGDLGEQLPGVELVAAGTPVEKLRAVKDTHEIALLREAVRIADEGFRAIIERGVIRAGVTEVEVGNELEYELKKRGAEGPAFPFIVASGVRSSLPHGRASDKVIDEGDFVTIDYGARYRGYNSDCTRTVVVGHATPRQREIYDIVLRAQHRVAAGLAPGMTGAQGDSLARDVISEAGYGEQFGHSLGHGIGRAVHEAPAVSQRNPDGVLVAGNVVSNEPGIYLPGWGGVRIEDLLLITETGNETLTGLEYKELTEV